MQIGAGVNGGDFGVGDAAGERWWIARAKQL
jgi:hypothetical protein